MKPSDPPTHAPRRAGPAQGAGYVRAFSTLGCPDADLRAVLQMAVGYGAKAVELRALGGTLDLPTYFAANRDATVQLASEFRAQGVRIAALDTSLPLMDASDSDFDEFLRFAPWAEAMGVSWLRVFDGGKTGCDEEISRGAAMVGRWEALRKERGWNVGIMVETHDALSSSKAIKRFTRAVPGVAMLWDSHCTWSIGGEDPAATWSAIGAHVVHVHVKDSRGQAIRGGPVAYSLPGKGAYPMAELITAIARNYTGCLSLEWEKKWHPELPSLAEVLESANACAWW